MRLDVRKLIPTTIRRHVKKALGLHALQSRVEKLKRQLELPEPETLPIAFWYDWNYCEPNVLNALRDLCRPGDVVWDVGANAGALSLLMSRLVGPRGVVCAFEASRRIVDKCQYNLCRNGCTNVQVFHCAVYHTSYEVVKIYAGAQLNDSLIASNTPGREYDLIKTIALDDFVAHSGLVPDLIKMDIEGTEYEALCGMPKLLENTRPHLILEQQPSDMRCHDLICSVGYIAVDLLTYRTIRSESDFSPGTAVANILFIHESRIDQTPYAPPLQREAVMTIPGRAFKVAADGSRELAEQIRLGPGRFLIELDFSADGTDNEVMTGVEADGRPIFRYHTNTYFISTSYRQWVIALHSEHALNIYFRFLNGTRDGTLDFRSVEISRVTNFDDVPPPLVE